MPPTFFRSGSATYSPILPQAPAKYPASQIRRPRRGGRHRSHIAEASLVDSFENYLRLNKGTSLGFSLHLLKETLDGNMEEMMAANLH